MNSLPKERIKQCNSKIYCQGVFLEHIQMSNIFLDSKTFVDMPAKKTEEQIISEFETTNPRSKKEIKMFIETNFYPAGFDLKSFTPPDWTANPPLLDSIADEKLKVWVKDLNLKWTLLVKQFDFALICKECATSAFTLKNPFVVPGGRFREFYYWDTFWIVKGLLACGMQQTVKGIIENFVEMIEKFGFIPNCSRIYCLNRSQPPVFARILLAYWEETGDLSLLSQVYPALEREYDFWMTFRAIEVPFQGKLHILNLYKASSYSPRPESFREDFKNAQKFPTEHQKQVFYDNMASIAESGWDFSTRWFFGKGIASSDILRIIPVDLNSFMLKNEEILAYFAKLLKLPEKVAFYRESSRKRIESMNELLWNEQTKSWNDWDMQSQSQKAEFYISNLLPLLNNNLKSERAQEILAHHLGELFGYSAGIPISSPEKAFSFQQWDFPNAWAPYEWFFFDWLKRNSQEKEAIFVAQRWINSTYCGYLRTKGYLFEKYHCQVLGQAGIGGEYIVQEGFGWTNGVILEAVRSFPKHLHLDSSIGKMCSLSMNGNDGSSAGENHLPMSSMLMMAQQWKLWTISGILCLLLLISAASAIFFRHFLAKWTRERMEYQAFPSN